MINQQMFELPISRTNFHGPKHVWAIEVRLYIEIGVFLYYRIVVVTVCQDAVRP